MPQYIIVSFFTELPTAIIERPISRYGIYLSLAGVLFHLFPEKKLSTIDAKLSNWSFFVDYSAPNSLKSFSEFAFTFAGGFKDKDFFKYLIAFFLSPMVL